MVLPQTLTYGDGDCEIDLDSHEWGCSHTLTMTRTSGAALRRVQWTNRTVRREVDRYGVRAPVRHINVRLTRQQDGHFVRREGRQQLLWDLQARHWVRDGPAARESSLGTLLESSTERNGKKLSVSRPQPSIKRERERG